jgi:hypothetical protein
LAASAYDEDGSAREIDGAQDRNRRGTGAIYVFTRSSAAWTQQAYLKASNSETGDSLGYSIAISQDGNTIAGGAGDEDCRMTGVFAGAVHICQDDQPEDNTNGAVYVFAMEQRTQQAFIKSSNPERKTGLACASHSAAMAILWLSVLRWRTADRKESTATEGSVERGFRAIYFFTRTGATWKQIAYVKASNADAYDEFGSAMALSKDGKLMAVGARGEASAVKGVNGNQNDNSALAQARYTSSLTTTKQISKLGVTSALRTVRRRLRRSVEFPSTRSSLSHRAS